MASIDQELLARMRGRAERSYVYDVRGLAATRHSTRLKSVEHKQQTRLTGRGYGID